MRRFVRFRGALALGMLLSLVASNAEAVAGDIHDGKVHHESVADAIRHHMLQGRRHDHLAEWNVQHAADAPVSLPPDDGDQAPGGHDHCSHLHGIALPAGFSLEFAFTVTRTHVEVAALPPGIHPQVQPHPPKA